VTKEEKRLRRLTRIAAIGERTALWIQLQPKCEMRVDHSPLKRLMDMEKE
jgi:hypothetical protein